METHKVDQSVRFLWDVVCLENRTNDLSCSERGRSRDLGRKGVTNQRVCGKEEVVASER